MSIATDPLKVAREAVEGRGAMQKVAELAPFLDFLAGRDLVHVLEIGGMRGGTMWAWSQVATGKLVGIDAFVLEGRMEHRPERSVLIKGDSRLYSTKARALAALDGDRVDLLFIDGDHSYSATRSDFELYAPLVRPGGLVAIHDVSVEQRPVTRPLHDVIPYWNQIRRLYRHQVFFVADGTPGSEWGGIGVLEISTTPYDVRTTYAQVLALGEPEQADRVPHIACPEYCSTCGNELAGGEDVLCRPCAALPSRAA